ncbi:hypothetical protein [Mesorhizobium sp.]|uniref:hypothetical protein n=1 Tax=Mesorhizobium sp. TaxID=1871066 RepID=UPI0025F93ACD|nr:hypothetical protein [Mesorhizobium sp.]
MDTPAQHYRASTRADDTARARLSGRGGGAQRAPHGEIRRNGGFVYVSKALAGEAVAAIETEDGEWALRFHAHPLGIIDTRRMKLVRRSAAGCLRHCCRATP